MVATRSRTSMGSSGHGSLASGDGTDKGQVFHKGVAISMWQNSGDDDSNWTNFIKSNFPFKALPFGFNRFSGKHSVLQSCPDTWNRYEEDVELAVKAGCNALRLSIEWARIEPRKGQIDMDAVARYHAMLDAMEAAGVEPNATLHHFTHPQVGSSSQPASQRPVTSLKPAAAVCARVAVSTIVQVWQTQ
eukprot:GHRQ01026736.1.p1 GENE.GHRQ01026736.1~~GHRQ01026736.1.p1  ORF type:complete len:189 (+),score=50.27 GHRQ01026736.1:292-858(+)